MTSADLITELQAARPTADPTLRERVRELAASAPPRRPSPVERLSRLSLRRFALVAVPATAVVLLALAGGVGLLDPASQPGVTSSRQSLELNPATSTTAGAQRAMAPQPKVGTAADAATPAPTTGRAQRYSAQLTLSVKDVDALSGATQQALRITRDLGGYLVSVSYATSDTGVSSLTLKVPTAKVQDAIVRLSGLGTIVSQQVQIDDLQGQVDELTKQETVLTERIARLSARIAEPDIDPEVKATLEARRDAARAQLQQVRAAKAQVEAEASYATIQLTLQTEKSSAVPAAPSRWDDTVDRAGEILAIEAMVVVTLLVVLAPLAIVVAAAWLARRGLRRRRDDELLAAR
jgi:Domain of unknown function (DUF4349)